MPRHGRAATPVFAASAALIAVAANEFLLLGFHVAETRNVNSIGAIAKRHFVFVPGHDPAGARAHVMIHQVVAEFAAAVGEAIGKFRGGGIEQDARGLQRRGAQEKYARLVFGGDLGLRVDHPHAADFSRVGIEDQAVHHAVRPDREFSGFLRRGQRRIQAAEVGRRDAAAMTYAAVVASGAPLCTCVSTAVRPMVRMRSSKFFASPSRKASSAQFISIGGRNFPSGSCGKPSACPLMPANSST